MMQEQPERTAKKIGFISTRLAGTDGVSLEAEKWAYVFQSQGCECYYMAGELDHPPEKSHLALLAHFNHPEGVFDGGFGLVEVAAVAEGIGRDVEDAHQDGAGGEVDDSIRAFELIIGHEEKIAEKRKK